MKKLICLLMAGLTACSTAPSKNEWRDASAPQSVAGESPRILDTWGQKTEPFNAVDPIIAPGFLLTLHSLADSKLDGDYRTDFNGDLQLPYDVNLHAAGLTLSALEKKLEDAYRPYFKTASSIDVRLKEQRYWIDVRGLVKKPGRYLMDPDASLDSAIGMAEGTTPQEPPAYVRIQKGKDLFILDLDQYYSWGEDHPRILGWLGGEVLFFQKDRAGLIGDKSPYESGRTSIFMMGEVRKPGEYSFNSGADFLNSLTQAGGFTEKADLDQIEVIRTLDGRKRVYDFSWNEFQNAPAPAQGDIVFVHADNTTKFERRTSIIATLIAAAASVVTSAILILAYNKGRV